MPSMLTRMLGPEHNLAATLSTVETRQVNNDYTIQLHGRHYRIESSSIVAGLRGAAVRVEKRLDGEVHVRFRERYLALTSMDQRPQPAVSAKNVRPAAGKHPGPSPAMRSAMDNLLRKPGPPAWLAGQIDRTRTSDKLD